MVSIDKIFHRQALPNLVSYLLRDEAISGKLILAATVLALIVANSPLQQFYDFIWHLNFNIGLGDWSLAMDLRHWVNEGLMTFFFLVVGLEIKREMVKGELRHRSTAILPIAAAIGGMIVPALLYIAFNHPGSDGFRGWAIPMATDIAFAVGILALLGDRVSASLKLFLLTLAIVDDIGAIIVIAVFYGSGFNFWMLGIAGLLALTILVLRKNRALTIPLFTVISILMWLAINQAGIHASIAGAILGLLAPVYAFHTNKPAFAERVERFAIPLSTLIVVPLFAFANTGVKFSLEGFTGSAPMVIGGIAAGLIIGKVVGIVGASLIMVKLGIGKLPDGTNWRQMAGVGFLAGIGFTVSIFVTELAFDKNTGLIDVAKLSIFAASAISGLLGLYLLKTKSRQQR